MERQVAKRTRWRGLAEAADKGERKLDAKERRNDPRLGLTFADSHAPRSMPPLPA